MNMALAIIAVGGEVAESVDSVPPSWEHWVLFIGSVLLALIVSFLCSLCEAAFLSISPAQVEDIGQVYPSRGRIWKKYKTHMEVPIAVILLLNTSAHTIGATVAGAQVHVLFGNAAVTVFSIIFTWLMLQYTEILPKTVGVRNNVRICQAFTYPMQVLIWFFTPIVWLLFFLNKPFEGKSTQVKETTLDELAALVGVAGSTNLLDKNQERILRETSRLHQRNASEVMVPAFEITFISSKQSLMEAILAAHIDPHTRFPVIESDDVNKILGYVNFKEMVAWARTNPDQPNVLPIIRPVFFVPDNEEVTDVLHLFVDRHAHIAIVQDEHKQTMGLITLEDIVEELVGELDDEFDSSSTSSDKPELISRTESLPKFINDLPEHVFIIGGGVPMNEVISILNKESGSPNWDAPVSTQTLSSWLISQMDHVPAPNEYIRISGWDFVIRRLRQNKAFDVLVLPEGQKGPLRVE